jgi:carboxymethylenebutenolidase
MPFEKMTMSDGAAIDVYRATPTGTRKGGLVLIQEIFGVTEHIRELCDQYAEDGYEVLAPALYDREHPGFQAGYNDEQFARAIELARVLHPIELSVADIQKCVDALVDKGPAFITGYCYGGTMSFLAACRVKGLSHHTVYRRTANVSDDAALRAVRRVDPDAGCGGDQSGASRRDRPCL